VLLALVEFARVCAEEAFMDHPRPNLRYVDADDLDTKSMKFDGLEVDSVNGDKLGKVEGFIIDVASGRPYHVVVGSGGWLKHKHFLLPIGHMSLATGNNKLIADVPKDRVEKFPGFDKDEFTELSDDDLKNMNSSMAQACCPTESVAVSVSEWDTPHYAYPTWWQAGFYSPDRANRTSANIAGATQVTGGGASGRDTASTDAARARELVTAREDTGDTSPHLGGRAQPGDVLGVETGGERTYVGDTAEDEDKRRRDAEEAARKR
jgi:hypothetical protein